ncbi:MAG: HIT family protein [Bacteroidales bacterium]|nr:HIT family protein [Bacteroidales bacterium]MBR6865020.1 HIT family protein [Bacteroidales bacterium]
MSPLMNERCPFCLVEQEREIIASSSLSIAFFDGFPVSPGHTLIIPRRHVASFFDLTEEERQDLLSLLDQVKGIVDEKYHPDGYNIGVNVGAAAGQSVFHVHMHLIPRYVGDVQNPKGGVRGVIPAKQKY